MLDVDYEHALIHLAWIGKRGQDGSVENRLVFGFIELTPRGCPSPLDEPSRSLNLGDEGVLRIARSATSARDAVSWYRAFSATHALFPRVYSQQGEPRALEPAGAFVEEPNWPACSTAPSDTSASALPLPFVPDWHSCPRVHHRICAVQPPTVLGSASRAAALSWLSEEFRFHFDQFEELLGSLHLIAPNPIFQELQARVVRDDHALALHLVSMNARPLTGLTLRLRNHQSSGVTSLHDHAIESPVIIVQLPTALGMVSWEIVCSERGLLYLQPETTFIARIEGRIDIVTERRRVEVPAPPAGTPSTLEVNVATSERFLAGAPEPRGITVSGIVLRARERRERSQAARRSGQRFFIDGQPEADRILRDLVHGARHDVLFVDPYFTANEIQRFALAVGSRTAGVNVLTWAGVLKKLSSLATVIPAAIGKTEGAVLDAHVGRLNADGRTNPIAVHVMGGKEPAIHDRFLIIDDDVWLLGSSFNSFGKSGTVLTKLIEPSAVRRELERQWTLAKQLSDWLREQPKPTFKERIRATIRHWLRKI